MRKISGIAGIALAVFLLFAFQDSKFFLTNTIPGTASHFTTDHLGNLYLAKGDVLEKYSPDGRLSKSLSNKTLGTITQVDASDPLKTLLFYRSFQKIIYVDNTLSATGLPVSLEELGYNQVTNACASHNNGFWIFNSSQSELVRFNNDLQKSQQTGNITMITGSKIEPCYLAENNNRLFLNDSINGILVFDIYGAYSHTIPLKGIFTFQVEEDEIIYFKDGKLKSYNIKTLKEGEQVLPDGKSALNARTEKEKLFVLKQKSLDIYQISH